MEKKFKKRSEFREEEGGSELILLLLKSQTTEMDENDNEVDEMREIRNESVSRFVRSSKSPEGSDSMLLEKR